MNKKLPTPVAWCGEAISMYASITWIDTVTMWAVRNVVPPFAIVYVIQCKFFAMSQH